MPPKRKTSWTPEDNERLKTMVENGLSVLRAAASLKCSMDAARTQARKLGAPFPTVREARRKFAGDPQSSWRSH
ncbi:MAG: hypothetical protein Q8M18_18875 [Bradyrhizobium sp.]|nr:hypothetical protein [Bradyrhizobium sp.]